MKFISVLPLLMCMVSLSYAEGVYTLSPFQISGGITASVLSDVSESESIGYEGMVGYRLRDYFLLEAGLAHYNFSDSEVTNFTPIVIRFKSMLPVSDYASLYMGGGAAYDGESFPLLTAGVNYRIDRNWYMDIGYQGIFNIHSVESDVYSFNISFVYQFSNQEKETSIVETAPIVPVVKEEKTRQATDNLEVCVKRSDTYIVKEGDYIISIARKHNMTLEHFLKINTQFSNRNLDLIYPDEIIIYNYIDCK